MARAVTNNRKALNTAIAWTIGLVIFFPILWTILTSFKAEAQAISIADNDPNWSDPHSVALAARSDPAIWLDQTEIYGDIGTNAAFRQVFATCLVQLQEIGAEATIRHYLDGYDMTVGPIAGRARR